MHSHKRERGAYYTRGNPFLLKPFQAWAANIDLKHTRVLEPFAGANNIVQNLHVAGLCDTADSFDVSPNDDQVKQRDTIHSFPSGYKVCVTNPPWLARNSATRRGLAFPSTRHDDLYKHCLELCLAHCDEVAALIPASFLHSGLFRDRLSTYILLHDGSMFNDTDNPVCLALFNRRPSSDIDIYYDDEFVGELGVLEQKIPRPIRQRQLRFNDVQGGLGFISFDNTRAPTIRFCDVEEIAPYPVKVSARFFTRIGGDLEGINLKRLNAAIDEFRLDTNDLFLTPFKGIRKDGWYRRRMSFALARKIINAT